MNCGNTVARETEPGHEPPSCVESIKKYGTGQNRAPSEIETLL
jgi:hypothetical protein